MGTFYIGNKAVAPIITIGGPSVGIPREVTDDGVFQIPTQSFDYVNDCTSIDRYAMYYGLARSEGVSSVSFPSLTTISGYDAMQHAFYSCLNLTTASFPSLTTLSGPYAMCYAFNDCESLKSASFPSLTTISGQNAMQGTFNACISLESVSFPSLTTVSGGSAMSEMFVSCDSLHTIEFPMLSSIIGSNAMSHLLRNSIGSKTVYFPALTTASFGSYKNQFTNMLMLTGGASNPSTLHFPSNLESTIAGLTGYPLFGGASGEVILSFDLPATE